MDPNLRVKPGPTLLSKTVDVLRKYIHDAYPNGGKIPGENVLSSTLGVNRGTLRSALSILEQDGLIIRRRGDGTYSNPYVLGIKTRLEDMVEYKDLIRSAGFKQTTVQLSADIEEASSETAEKLNIEPAACILASRNVFLADGNPVIYVEEFIPVAIIREKYAKRELKASVFSFLENRAYQKIAYGFTEIIPSLCGEEISPILKMDAMKPILVTRSVIYNDLNEPIMSSHSYFKEPFIRYHVVKRRKDNY